LNKIQNHLKYINKNERRYRDKKQKNELIKLLSSKHNINSIYDPIYSIQHLLKLRIKSIRRRWIR